MVKPWAKISIDGRRRGQTPKTFKLPPGPHRIHLSNPQLDKHTTFTVKVRSNRFKLIERDWR